MLKTRFKKFKTLENFLKATRDDLLQIGDIGDIVADSILSFLNDFLSTLKVFYTLR